MFMGGVVIVSGVPGVGKSTVLNKAIDMLASEGINVGIVNYGTIMLEEALDKKLVSHRDEMRKLKVVDQLRLQKLAALKIRELAGDYDILIVDTHLFIFTPRGRWPGLSVNNLSELDVKQVIVVEASPEEIAERRLSDKTRIRERTDIAAIKEDLEYNRFLAAALSIQTSSPAIFIANHDNMVDEAAKEIYMVLRKLVDEL
jgi:adenylate kinase